MVVLVLVLVAGDRCVMVSAQHESGSGEGDWYVMLKLMVISPTSGEQMAEGEGGGRPGDWVDFEVVDFEVVLVVGDRCVMMPSPHQSGSGSRYLMLMLTPAPRGIQVAERYGVAGIQVDLGIQVELVVVVYL